jgi:glycerol transport system ATP-binding protein
VLRLELQEISLRSGPQPLLYPMRLALEPLAVTGLAIATQGHVKVDGVEVSGMPLRQRNVVMVYQPFIHCPSMNVFDHLASPLKLRGDQQMVAEAHEVHPGP